MEGGKEGLAFGMVRSTSLLDDRPVVISDIELLDEVGAVVGGRAQLCSLRSSLFGAAGEIRASTADEISWSLETVLFSADDGHMQVYVSKSPKQEQMMLTII